MVVSTQTIDKNTRALKEETPNSVNVDLSGLELGKFKLASLLQSTLELKVLLKYFLENIRENLTVDGLYYQDEERCVKIRLGRQSTHSCGYRLINSGADCGEITFKRDTRFNEIDLQRIENSILLLLAPISNAIKYSDALSSANQNSIRQVMNREDLHASLQREIELAKRHNHPLAIINIAFQTRKALAPSLTHTEKVDVFADLMLKNKDCTNLLYRTAKQEFLLVTPNNPDLLSSTIESVKAWHDSVEDDFETPPLQLNIGYATVTGTDSVKSVIGRAKKSAVLC